MCKSELFLRTVECVCIVSGVNKGDLLSGCKRMEVVDARSMLCKILYDIGFYPGEIGRYINKTSACVRFLLSDFERRKKVNKILDTYMQNIHKQLANNFSDC